MKQTGDGECTSSRPVAAADHAELGRLEEGPADTVCGRLIKLNGGASRWGAARGQGQNHKTLSLASTRLPRPQQCMSQQCLRAHAPKNNTKGERGGVKSIRALPVLCVRAWGSRVIIQ